MIPRLPALASLVAVVCLGAASAPAETGATIPASVIVKFRSEGPHALLDCAETLSRRGEPLAPHTADRSDSLDALQHALGVRSVRALFRRPDGSPFALQRRRLEERLERAWARRGRPPGAAPLPPAAAGLAQVYRVGLPPGADEERAAKLYAADPHVEYAQPNFAVSLDTFDDPYLHSQGSWGRSFPDLWGLYRIGAPAAWERSQGEGIVVAVVDTGIDYEHPDIVDNLWINPGEDLNGNGRVDPEDWNGIDDDGNGFVDDLRGYDFHDSSGEGGDGDSGNPEAMGDPDPYDENGHGTHVAGIVAARGNNGLGVAGVAPRAKVMAVQAFGPDGTGETARIWAAVLYAAENGARVINGSFSCSSRCPENPLAEQVVRLVTQLGSVFVTSAGNRASDIALLSPEKMRETITVGSIDPQDELSSTSSFGWLVDVVAPGTEILSLRASHTVFSPTRFVGNAYMWLSGTSMAAPHVSGAIALLLADRPELGFEQLRAILRLSAEDLGPPGRDRRFGSGLLRPDLALDTHPPDLRGAIEDPAPGETLEDARAETFEIHASAAGADLASREVDLGVGSTPEDWHPLPAIGPQGEGETIHHWEIGSTPDGAYVVRLRLEAGDGRVVEEFAPVAIDRNPPRLVSSADRVASHPVVSDGRAVWEVLSDQSPQSGGVPDRDLFVGSLHGEVGSPLVVSPQDQFAVAFSGAQVAWQQRPVGALPSELLTCVLHGPEPRCEPVVVAGTAIHTRPSLSGRRIVYNEVVDGRQQLELCELDRGGRHCETQRLASQSAVPLFPLIDDRRILWTDLRAGINRLVTCRLDPRSGACPEVETSVAGPFVQVVGLSGNLVAYDELVMGGAESLWRLALCALDPETGECPATQVASGPRSFEAARLSGRRLVWHEASGIDQPDVYFCVYDAGRCIAQRITSELGEQANASIDGRDVVWEDDRGGSTRIASLELPALAPIPDRQVFVGEPLAFAVRALRPEDPDLVLSVRTGSGGPVEELGARLEPDGPLRARFVWRPGPRQVGDHALRFRARRPSGLFDERTIHIEVRERRGRPSPSSRDR